VAVAGVTAAKDNAVGASLESTEYKHRIDSARTGYSDYLYVCRIIESVRTGEVCSGIGTPVTAERYYQRLEIFVIIYLHIASTSAIIWLLEKPLRSIAPEGQATVQAPQPWHTAGLTLATLRTFVVRSGILNSLSM